MKTISSMHRMRGLSMPGWMIAIVVAAMIGTAALKIIPAFLDFNTIKGLIENVLSDPKVGLQSPEEIRIDLSKRFQINRVDVIQATDLDISKQGSEVVIKVDYEVRENYFANIDFVISFNREFRKSVR